MRYHEIVTEAVAPTGSVKAYHATSPNVPIQKIMPFMHLGTLKAAQDRGKQWSSPAIYEFDLMVQKPLRCRDGHGAQHPVVGMVEWLETELNLKYAMVDDLLMRCRADQERGVPPSLAGGRAIASVLRKRGYDFLWYENEIEDPGSVSWIVIDPSHVKLVGRIPPP
jgi:hypothetical protein